MPAFPRLPGPTGARAHKARGPQVLRLADALANKVSDTRYVPAAAGAGSPAVLTVLSMNICGQGPLGDSPIPASILILRGNVAYEYRVAAFPDMPPVRATARLAPRSGGPRCPYAPWPAEQPRSTESRPRPWGLAASTRCPCGWSARMAWPESVSRPNSPDKNRPRCFIPGALVTRRIGRPMALSGESCFLRSSRDRAIRGAGRWRPGARLCRGRRPGPRAPPAVVLNMRYPQPMRGVRLLLI
jgi:hypothetical protein